VNHADTTSSLSIDPAAHPRGFASDNFAGVHPEVIDAIARANVGHAPAYGDDAWTEHFREVMRTHFGAQAEAYPVFNGTGANVISLQAALPRWGAVICAQTAHIHGEEGGAPEKVGGLKLLTVATAHGKLTPELVDREAWGWGFVHRAQPLAVSIAQSTEVGTTYTPDEVRALADHAHEHGMVLHMDGSRLSNAAAHLNCSLAELTTEAGVDVLSLGGTKNGLLGAEAIVALNPEAVPGLPFLQKLNMQLGSKSRFIAAQLAALYERDLWLNSARHANQMAAYLHAELQSLVAANAGEASGITVAHPVQANVVFATLPPATKARAHDRFAFYDWPGDDSLVRLMCSFDTTTEDIDALIAAIAGAS
jgi:threonine aldolase